MLILSSSMSECFVFKAVTTLLIRSNESRIDPFHVQGITNSTPPLIRLESCQFLDDLFIRIMVVKTMRKMSKYDFILDYI